MSDATFDAEQLGALFGLCAKPVFPALEPNRNFHHHSLPAWDATGGPAMELGSSIESNKTLLDEPAVLVSKLNPRKPRVAVVKPRDGERHCASTEFMCFVPRRPDEDLNYWAYYLASSDFSIRLQRVAVGSTNSHTRASPSEVIRWTVPNPPPPQKRAIAAILDTLDTAIRQTEAIIEKLKQVKQGLLHDLLTRGIDANGELRPPQSQAPHLYKESPLGWAPREWSLQPFSELCESSAFGPRFPGDAYNADGPLATLRTTDMDDEGNIELASMPRAAINPQTFAAHLLRPGDLVISRSGTCGVSGVFEGHSIDVVPGAFLIRFRLRDRRHAQFFRRYFNSTLGRPRLSRLAVGGVQKNIKGSDVLRLDVAVPPPSESVACQRLVDAHEREDRELRLEAAKLRALKSGLMDDLFTGRVRVTPLLCSAES